jgi:hypothetical protein
MTRRFFWPTAIILVLLPLSMFAQETILSEEGELRRDDESYGENLSIDWFGVTVPDGQRLHVRAVSADFTPRLVFEGPSGRAEHPGSRYVAEGAIQFPGPARLRVGVTTSGRDGVGGGMYSVRARLSPTLPALTGGRTERGALETSDEKLPDGRPVDWYPLEVAAGTRVLIALASEMFASHLVIRYPDGRERYVEGFVDREARIHISADEDLYLMVGATRSTYSATRGDYELTVEETEPLRLIQRGRTIRGRVEAGEVAVFGLSGAAGDAVEIVLTSSDMDAYLLVREFSGETWHNDDRASGDSDSALRYFFNTEGIVEIEASSYMASIPGSYELRVESVDVGAPIEEVVDGQVIASETKINAVISTAIESEIPFFGISGYLHRYVVHAEKDHRFRLSMSSDFFDTFVHVTAPSGDVFANDDGPFGGTDSLVEFVAPESGAYDVVATSFGGRRTGPYTISYEMGEPVRVLEHFFGELPGVESLSRDVGGRRTHAFEGRAGQHITIDLSSEVFDTYLILEGPDGTVLAENDDSVFGTDSQIAVELLSTGTYTIVVRGYLPDAAGPYEVTVVE